MYSSTSSAGPEIVVLSNELWQATCTLSGSGGNLSYDRPEEYKM